MAQKAALGPFFSGLRRGHLSSDTVIHVAGLNSTICIDLVGDVVVVRD
jgi:hypothetical protein